MVPQRFDGRVILVTGSTGIAAASAHRLAAEGASVVVASRTEEHCRSLAEAITSAGGTASYEVADLTDDGAADRIVAATVERHRRLDGVFSVAGGSGRRFGDGPGARGNRRRLGRHARLERPHAISCVGRGSPPDAQPGPGCRRPARRDPAHGLGHQHQPVADVLRDPRLCRGERRDRRAHPDHGLATTPRRGSG